MAIASHRFLQIEVAHIEEWRAWLAAHHDQSESIWVVTFLKSDPDRYVGRFDLLDEALCFGWIDGLRRKVDGKRTMQLFSPRRHQHWTATYRERVARLLAEGRMAQAGLDAVGAAKRAGTWYGFADVDALVVSDDLAAALSARPPALENFGRFAPSSRRNMLRWLAQAKTAATRAKHIMDIAERAASNEKIPLM